jgi:hypothetical protein
MGPVRSDDWKGLLSLAVSLVRGVEETGLRFPPLVFGGGTVLMLRHGHRLSRDIDLFLDHVRYLRFLTPRINSHVESLATDYAEDANTLKLVFGLGDIDFIAASSVTGVEPREEMSHDGMRFLLESTEEILAKKLYFRAPFFTDRDVFDLVAVASVEPEAAAAALDAAAPRRRVLRERISRLAARAGSDPGRVPIAALPRFSGLVPGMYERAAALLDDGAPGPATSAAPGDAGPSP